MGDGYLEPCAAILYKCAAGPNRVYRRRDGRRSWWPHGRLPSRDFAMLVDLYLQGRLYLDRFASETIALDDAEEAFQ